TQGVVDYNAKIFLDAQDDRVRPGMSVSASVITSLVQDVVLVPSGAVHVRGAGATVDVVPGVAAGDQRLGDPSGTFLATPPTATQVTVGQTDGNQTEITAGIKEGDVVVSQVLQQTSSAPATGGAGGLGGLRIPGVGGGGGGGNFRGGGAGG